MDVAAAVRDLPWQEVHGPARGVAYELIKTSDPELARELHDVGWAGHTLRPLGGSPPMFRGAPRVRGRYTMSDHGSVWFGSPVPRIAAALLGGLAGRSAVRWGSVELSVKGVELEQSVTEVEKNGELGVTTATPVLVKHDSRYIGPDHPDYASVLLHNLRHKADLLGLPSQVEIEVLDAGPMRRFEVNGAPRHGATVTARLSGDPRLLAALHEWGLGLGNNQGFGWVR